MAGGGIRTYTTQDLTQANRIKALGELKGPYLNRIKEYLARIGAGTESQKSRARGRGLADVAMSSPPPGFSPGRSTGADLFNRQNAISSARARAATMSGDKFDMRDAQQKLAAAGYGEALRRAVLDSGTSLQNAAAMNRVAIAQNKATVGNSQMGMFGSLAGAAIGLAGNYYNNPMRGLEPVTVTSQKIPVPSMTGAGSYGGYNMTGGDSVDWMGI